MAVRTGSGSPALLYGDGVQSTVYSTSLAGTVTSATSYRAFGGTRLSEGAAPTDRRYTGQREDATGIYYFNARYYDPQIGQFLSPDTIVPDPSSFLSYNRYLYALGNPLKYNDPSGHCSNEVPSSDNAEAMQAYMDCWQLAGVILMMYNNDPWWQEHFKVDQQTFYEKAVVQPTQDARWMREQLDAWEFNFKMRTGQQVGRVEWHEPDNPDFQFLGQGVAAAVADDIAGCQANPSLGCSNLLDDASVVVTGGAMFVCAAASGGTCLLIGGGASTIISGVSSGITTVNAINGDADAADAVVAWSTTAVGGKFGNVGKGVVGFGVSVIQRIYDWWTGQQ